MSKHTQAIEDRCEEEGAVADRMRAAAARFRAEIAALRGHASYATVRQYADALTEAIDDVELPDPGDMASEIEADYPWEVADREYNRWRDDQDAQRYEGGAR